MDKSNITITKNTTLVGKIKTDGYYYNLSNGRNNLIFYNDGVVLHGVDEFKGNNFEGFENNLLTLQPSPEYKPAWGAVQVDGEVINWQRITFKGGLSAKYSEYILWDYEGKVLSDSVFVLEELSNDENDELTMHSDTFYFRQFSHKPDSINDFVPN